MNDKKRTADWTRMTAGELARATAEFDREFAADSFGPPGKAAAVRHARAKRKRGRPVVGQGARAVSVTLERSILERTDALALRLRLPRSRLIERGLLGLLAKAGT